MFDKWTSSDDIKFAKETDATTTFTMPANAVTVTATYTNAPVVATHTITASAGGGGTISPSGNISVTAGENRFFSISSYIGYSILSVTVDGVNKGAISNYFFTNVTANHSISVTFSYIGGMKPGDSTGIGIKIPPTTDIAINPNPPPITITTTNPILPIIGEIKTLAMMDKNGNASFTLADKTIADAIKKAQDEAKKSGTEKNGVAVALNVDTGKKIPESISANLSKTVLDSLIENKVSEFSIKSETVNLNFDSKTLQEIQKQAGGDATINASKADVSKLSKEAQNAWFLSPITSLLMALATKKMYQNLTTLKSTGQRTTLNL